MKVQLCRYEREFKFTGEKVFFFFVLNGKKTNGYQTIEHLIENSYTNESVLPESYDILEEFEIEESVFGRSAEIRKHLEEFMI